MNALHRALESLEGLSIGDGFGQCFFQMKDSDEAVATRTMPEAPWLFTDDTEMSLSVVSVLAQYGVVDQDVLADSFARHYDYDRAYGPSMHRVLARIRAGEHWRQVSRDSFEGQGSWGNGASMRAAPLGAFFADDLDTLVLQAKRSAEVTHIHPEGVAGAIAVAMASAQAARARASDVRPSPQEFLESVLPWLPASEVASKIGRARSIPDARSIQFAVSILGNGTDMSAQDTVPLALWCCALHLDDFAEAIWLAVSAGGDRDTICAIVGGIVVSRVGLDRVPDEWRRRREPLPTWHVPEKVNE